MIPRSVPAVWLLLASTGVLGCGDTTEPAPTRVAYTIAFANGETIEYRSSDASFITYNAREGWGVLWVAEYFIGDSLEVFEFLPVDTDCPVARTLVASTAALGGSDLASFSLRHKALAVAAYPDASSRVVLDSARGGAVWGKLNVRLNGNDTQRFPATLTGQFELVEQGRYGLTPHCA